MTKLSSILNRFFNEIRAPNGDLPESVTVDVVRISPAIDGSLTLKVADKGVTHGAIAEPKADMVAQMFMFNIRLPQEGLKIFADERMVHPVAQQ